MGTVVLNKQILLTSTKCKLNSWSLNCDGAPNLARPSESLANVISDSSPSTLDPHIWSNLQPELVARILAHFPLTSLFAKRLVSKSWNGDKYSIQVLGDISIRQNFRSWLFLFENGGPQNPHKLHAFDPMRSDWHIFTNFPHFATVQKIGGLSLCGAAAGLMVFKISSLKSHFTQFGIFNPITTSWKKLPLLLNRRQNPVVNMFWEDSAFEPSTRVGGNYKLVVTGGLEHGLHVQSTEVYDSRTEKWQITCERFSNQQHCLSDEMRASTAFCNGTVYHVRFNQRFCFGPNREFHTLMTYDTKQPSWVRLRLHLPANLVFTDYPSLKRTWEGRAYVAEVVPPSLVGSNGRLLLIGYQADQSHSIIAGIGIWVLRNHRVWELVTSVPDTLFNQMYPMVSLSANFDPSSFLRYTCQAVGHGDIVYILQSYKGQPIVVLCDLSQTPPGWRRIRESVVPKMEYSQILQGCVIDPRFDSVI